MLNIKLNEQYQNILLVDNIIVLVAVYVCEKYTYKSVNKCKKFYIIE